MRFLFVLLLLSLGFGALIETTNPFDSVKADGEVMLGSAKGIAPAAGTLLVDRGDDPEELFPCTDAPADCPLRSALAIANTAADPTEILFADHFIITLSRPLPPVAAAGVAIRAGLGQEIRISGDDRVGPLFHVTGEGVTIEGLRLYGAAQGSSIIRVSGSARDATIANNLIGDDDAPQGNCGQSDQASAGINIDATAAPGITLAWIHGNIIECIGGAPGVGILVQSGNVAIGKDSHGNAGESRQNIVRLNQGHGIYLGDSSGNTVCHNLIHDNRGDGLAVSNFNNNIFDNSLW